MEPVELIDWLILKNWLTQLWRVASPKSAGWSSRPRKVLLPPLLLLPIKSKGLLLAEFPLAQRSVLCSVKVFSWLGEVHLHSRGYMLYSKSIDLNVNLTQITLTETSRILMFDGISGHCGPAKVTSKLTITVSKHLNHVLKTVSMSGLALVKLSLSHRTQASYYFDRLGCRSLFLLDNNEAVLFYDGLCLSVFHHGLIQLWTFTGSHRLPSSKVMSAILFPS